MRKTYLILDTTYLCHRALYSTGTFKHGSVAVGVIFGLFRSIINLRNIHQTDDILFAFDHGKGLREQAHPDYKAMRRWKDKNRSHEEKGVMEQFHRQVGLLKTQYLSELGYNNVFYEEGYEADDIIASLVKKTLTDEFAIIVSGDKDLYQLLSDRTVLWNPIKKTLYTKEDFREEWFGLHPKNWPLIKSLAGCATDNVKGIAGVGEITAAKWAANRLKTSSPLMERIHCEGDQILDVNYPLVKLPYKGCPVFDLKEDEVTNGKWRQLTEKLGFKSMESQL